MDVEGIKAGEDFARVLEKQVSECDVMLALIGRSWLKVTDKSGRRRLDNERDFVRIEIESALKLGKWVIPVLLHKEAEIPSADDLPQSLQSLTLRTAVTLTQQRFRADAQGLITEVERALAEVEQARQQDEQVLIIRPFGKKAGGKRYEIDFDLVQQELIAPALQPFGLKCRYQDIFDLEGRPEDILRQLMIPNLAIADISIESDAVTPLLGTRLLSGKKTILLQDIESDTKFPSRGNKYHHFRYDPWRAAESVTLLTRLIRETLYPGSRSS